MVLIQLSSSVFQFQAIIYGGISFSRSMWGTRSMGGERGSEIDKKSLAG